MTLLPSSIAGVSRIALLLLSLAPFVGSLAQDRTPPYPQRETNPEAVARGKKIYETYACVFCHGADTRGGNGGPSLLRSQIVQRDQHGELIGPVIRNGVPNTQMVAIALDDQQVADVAEFLHSFEVLSRDPGVAAPDTIVVGDADAGRVYFEATCAGCHSAQGDLRGIATRFDEPIDLQTQWLMPRDPPPTQVSVTEADGSVVSGTLLAIDEFIVRLELSDGSRRSFRRRGGTPHVDVRNPLQAHKDLLPRYADADIHNVTAWLVTLTE